MPIVAALMEAGLGMLGNAVLAKGKEVVEDKLGIKLPEGDKPLDPAQVLELKRAEMAHEEWLIEAGIRKQKQDLEETGAYLADVQDARKMQGAALAQDDVFSKRFLYYFAIGWSAFAGLYIMIVSLVNIPQTSLRFVDTVLGFLLGTIVATMINFFFGTSKSSRAKDDTIAEAVKHVTGR